MEYKFEVGDVVKMNKNADEKYFFTTTSKVKEAVVKGYLHGAVSIKITKGCPTMIGDSYCVNEKHLTLVRKAKLETIVIYRDGQKVIALDKYTGKKAEAKCNTADEFDFRTGAKLAFQRLFDGVEKYEKDKICVGDTVKVENTGKQYSSYTTWSGLDGYKQNFVVGSIVSTEDNYKVLAIKKHDNNDRNIALIQNPKTTQVFIINIEGLSKVER